VITLTLLLYSVQLNNFDNYQEKDITLGIGQLIGVGL